MKTDYETTDFSDFCDALQRFLRGTSMKSIAEAFALAQWLEEYPSDLDYQTILERIEDGDESIYYIDLIEYETPEAIIQHIESTKQLFALYAAQAVREAKR